MKLQGSMKKTRKIESVPCVKSGRTSSMNSRKSLMIKDQSARPGLCKSESLPASCLATVLCSFNEKLREYTDETTV